MIRSKKIEGDLNLFLDQIPAGCTPGLLIQVFEKGQKVIDLRWGQTWTFYDLASLTKPLFTVMAAAWAYDQGFLDIETPVKKWIPDYPSNETTVRQLLCHLSELPAYAHLYRDFPPSVICGGDQVDAEIEKNKKTLISCIVKLPMREPVKALYSDLGYLLLIPILEEVYQKSLPEIWQHEVLERFYPGVNGLHFCYRNCPVYQKDLYAPTERCSWRNALIQGEVHDEHAWLLGGVSTHAGLFGSIDDVSWAVLSLRAQVLGYGKKILKQKTAQVFFQRSMDPEVGDWALGLMLPTPGSSSSGRYFSLNALGHLGFTGCSFWFDPMQDLIVVLLSNRVYFGRDNKEFAALRPTIHDKIYELLRKY